MVNPATVTAVSASTASEAQIREGLDGNICRCTGYHNIVKAVQHCQSGQQPAAA